MLKYLLWGFAIVYSTTQPIVGCDARLLDSEAETMNFNISAGAKISVSTVRESLNFIYDVEKVDPKYSNPRIFSELYDSLNREIPTNNFLSFMQLCKQVYEQETSPTTKGAVHMLLEKVGKKAQPQYRLEQRHMAVKVEAERAEKDIDLAQMVDYFSNIDKSPMQPRSPNNSTTSVH
ncbi:MAG: hypothetical protein FJX71_01085 [Alphaproteobacteria bacterium]|nr:hypothetical protein [Alphaproteobacteria bacterium]